jgi:hypothetical protein
MSFQEQIRVSKISEQPDTEAVDGWSEPDQMPCRDHAAPMACSAHETSKATMQGHGTARHGHGMACVN